jgi:hypothetical protein
LIKCNLLPAEVSVLGRSGAPKPLKLVRSAPSEILNDTGAVEVEGTNTQASSPSSNGPVARGVPAKI